MKRKAVLKLPTKADRGGPWQGFNTPLIAEEAAEDEKLGLDDSTLIIEDTGETEPETATGPEEEENIDDIELSFDDLELEDEDKT